MSSNNSVDLLEDGAFAASKNSWNRYYSNSVVQPLLTDLYQITMAYAYWKSGKIDDHAVFDLFFRTNPFHGEFTIFAGLEECLKFMENFHYSETDIEYLKHALPQGIEEEFFEYLSQLTAKDVTLYALKEGSVAFPRVPLIKVAGPLIIVQLLETTLLTLVNYASLMATNAARYRMVAGRHINLLEFGLRRAQGPDGGLSASKYAYIGGFDGTSNVLAGKLFNIPVKGTHAHAYITSFTGTQELKTRVLAHKETGDKRDLLELAIEHRVQLSKILDISTEESSEGELAAMVSFAIAFPDGFMALVDTYDVKRGGNRYRRTKRQRRRTVQWQWDDVPGEWRRRWRGRYDDSAAHVCQLRGQRTQCQGLRHPSSQICGKVLQEWLVKLLRSGTGAQRSGLPRGRHPYRFRRSGLSELPGEGDLRADQ